MNATLARRAGDAMIWQGIQFGGVKLVDLIRIVVLARLLAPSEFGLFAVALVALDFLLGVTNFGMVQALVQRPDATRAHYESAWTINFLRAVAVGAGLALLAPWVADLFGEPGAADLLRFLALRPVIEATASIGLAELEKNLKFRSLALLKLAQATVNAVVSIALVAPFGVWALVVGPVTGAVAFALISYLLCPIAPRIRLRGAAAGHLVRYGRWIMVTAWVAVAGRTLVQLGISRELGTVALGLYFMATKLAFLPAHVSAQVVASVAFPVFAMVQKDPDRTRQVFRTTVLGLSALVGPAAVLIIVLAPSIAADLLGERWIPAVPLIQWLALKTILVVPTDAMIPLFNGVGRPAWTSWVEAAHYGLVLPVALVFAGPWGVVGVAAAWIPAVLVSQLLGIVLMRRMISAPFKKLAGPLVSVMAASILGAIAAFVADLALSGAAGVIAAGLVGGCTAYAVLLVLESRLGLGLTENAVQLFPWSEGILRRLGLGHRIGGHDGRRGDT